MKYLKTYESLDNIEYKKFIVLLENNILFVYKVLEQYTEEDTFILRMVAKYKDNKLNDNFATNKLHVNAYELEKEIVFQSNDYQEVIDMLPTLSKSTKYNL